MRLRRTVGWLGMVVGLVAAAPRGAEAQVGVSLWLGVGEAADSGASSFGLEAKQVGAQLAVPAIPVALRAEGLFLGDGVSFDGFSWSLNAVVGMSLPLLQPYAIAGRGSWKKDKDTSASGWNYGGGVRLGVLRFGVFAEMRRHVPLKRTITVFGVTL